MKKKLIPIILTSFFFVLSFVVMAQTHAPAAGEPGDPGGDPGTGTEPPIGGGGAPIGGGTLILMGLGAAYGGKKVYTLFKENQEALED